MGSELFTYDPKLYIPSTLKIDLILWHTQLIIFYFLQLKNKIKLFSNSLKCPRAKSSNHCLTELFSIYQNKHWTIRRRDDHIVVPSSNRIKSKID